MAPRPKQRRPRTPAAPPPPPEPEPVFTLSDDDDEEEAPEARQPPSTGRGGTAGARPGWNSIGALKTGRVVNIPAELNTMLGRPGPRLPQALRGLAKIVHPELFK